MARLHIIESRHDIAPADMLVKELQKFNHQVTWDRNYLVPGIEWRRALEEAVFACDVLVAVFSSNSVSQNAVITSQWMAADIGAARGYRKLIIPVLIDTTINIPELVNDLFTIMVTDPSDLADIAKQVDDATRIYMVKKSETSVLNLPPGYQHLTSAVMNLQKDAAFEKSVFVMMKFPDAKTMKPKAYELLVNIWEELVQVLDTYGLRARRADKKMYHDQMWENICVYMLGCKYGIAVLEDKAAAELNPNVTLEYGFMKALNANVMLFRDVNFKHDRADLTGKLAKNFTILDDLELDCSSLSKAVQEWLVDLGIPQITNR